MAEYDSLPPDIRKLIREAPYNMAINFSAAELYCMSQYSWVVDDMVVAFGDHLEEITRESVIQTYGHEHPQARK